MREDSISATSPNWVEALRKVMAWPVEALEARRVRADLAAMSDRERSDIGGVRLEDAPVAMNWREESSEERAARARAIRAWYGHYSKAA